MPKLLDWLWEICPICRKRYCYLVAFKPVTCGKYDCVHEAHKRGLIYKDKVSEANLPTV